MNTFYVFVMVRSRDAHIDMACAIEAESFGGVQRVIKQVLGKKLECETGCSCVIVTLSRDEYNREMRRRDACGLRGAA